MQYLTIAAGLLAAISPASSHAVKKYQRCLESEPSEDFRSRSANFQSEIGALAVINVKTFAHVVTTQAAKGNYPLAQIKRQIAVMNKSYRSSGIKFTLASTDFTVNNAWATTSPGDDADVTMKNKLHKGTYADLNLYFLSDLNNNQGLLGFCPFPYTDIEPNNSTYTPYIKYDGCLILADSMPGGSAAPYNLGYTAPHEIGHWFGLYHVFQGNSCTGDGDFVNDTPPQRTATGGCPKSKNTCPGGGPDSIHNYMDYSDDRCLNQFTRGQTTRSNAVYKMFRACNGHC